MDQTLVARATEMFGTRRTWVLGGRRYAISGTAEDAIWYVDLSLNPPFCSCPQFAYRCQGNDVCKHIVHFWAFGRFYEGDDAVQRRWGSRDEPLARGGRVGVVRNGHNGVEDHRGRGILSGNGRADLEQPGRVVRGDAGAGGDA
jgi:SWIM zinc finger